MRFRARRPQLQRPPLPHPRALRHRHRHRRRRLLRALARRPPHAPARRHSQLPRRSLPGRTHALAPLPVPLPAGRPPGPQLWQPLPRRTHRHHRRLRAGRPDQLPDPRHLRPHLSLHHRQRHALRAHGRRLHRPRRNQHHRLPALHHRTHASAPARSTPRSLPTSLSAESPRPSPPPTPRASTSATS